MTNFTPIVNWENVFKQETSFKNAKPFKFGFVEGIFQPNFYNKLYDTYPSLDKFNDGSDWSKSQLSLRWGNSDTTPMHIVDEGDDLTLSEEWNTLKRYTESEEFLGNLRKFSGVPVNKVKQITFIAYRSGGFQLPHIHNVGPSSLVLMFYFSKGWKQGDPGGTYISADVNESAIIFEPYDHDNSMALFHDGPNAAHGTRRISKDVERRAFQITLEEWSPEEGWSGGNPP